MVKVWRPSEDHERYMHDPAYLEFRFGVSPLQELRSAPGVIGVARFVVMPSFSGESVQTFVYGQREVSIEVCHAEHSLWYSLGGGNWVSPLKKTYTKALGELPTPLSDWTALKEAAQAAPTVTFAIIDGQEYRTLDGVLYRHQLADSDTILYAAWSNPNELASNHVSQVRLVRAYEQAMQTCIGQGA
jgi:hypothetical protein